MKRVSRGRRFALGRCYYCYQLGAGLYHPASQANYYLDLSNPAPAGGVVLSLTSSLPGVVVPDASVTVPAGQSRAYFGATGVSAGGPATITVSASGWTSGSFTLTVYAPEIRPTNLDTPRTTFSGPDTIGSQITCSGGGYCGRASSAVTVSYAVTAPSPVGIVAFTTATGTIAAGQNTSDLAGTLGTPTSAGTYTVTPSATGFTSIVSGLVTVNLPSITSGCYYCYQLGAGLYHPASQANYYLDLSNPAPAGGVVINVASTDPTIATATSVTVPAGQTRAYFGATGILPGVIQISVSAPGWSGSSFPLTVYAPEIRVQSLITARNVASAPDTVGANVTCSGGGYCGLAVNATPVTFAVTTPNPAGIVSLTTATVTIAAGTSSQSGAVIGTPTAIGTYAVTPFATGFTSIVSATATVSNSLTIYGSGTVGAGLTLTNYYYVSVNDAVATPQTITLTSSDPTKLLVATATIPAGSTYGYFAVSGVAAGSPTLTANKTGWTSSTAVTVPVAATGLAFLSGPPTSQLLASGPATFYVYARCGTSYCGEFTAAPVVTLTSSAPSVATVAVLSATAGSQYFSGTMTPVAAGTYTITAAIPGFTTSTSGTLTIQ